MKFEMLKDKAALIKVIGVGGGGGNAVNHMYHQGISGVDFVVCNTDGQALELSPVPNKVQLGASLTEGRGAGSIPDVGKNSAIENIDQLKDFLGVNTKMVFITAGMGGGTGTGASPIIAQAAKEMGILTVGIVTTPFSFEGRRRTMQAEEGLAELKRYVDTLLVISNDKLSQMFGGLSLSNAFAEADNILTTAAKGIAEIITLPGYINVDFEDVKTVMTDGGVALMGSHKAEGDNRARKAVEGALNSPLLNDNQISGARYILLNITSGNNEVLLEELTEITGYSQEQAGSSADMIWGHCHDESLGDAISVTIIATGFKPVSEQPAAVRNESGWQAAIPPVQAPEKSEPAQGKEIQASEKENPAPETGKVVKPLQEEAEPKEEISLRVRPDAPAEQTRPDEPVLKKNEPARSNEFRFSLDTGADTNKQSTTPYIKGQEPAAPSGQASMFSDAAGNEQRPVRKAAGTGQPELSREQEPGPADPDPQQEQSEEVSIEEQLRRSRERIMRLKDLSLKLRSSNGLAELENEPAYKRRNRNLENVPHSSESQMSRFTISNDDEIRPNNSFLHDNVD